MIFAIILLGSSVRAGCEIGRAVVLRNPLSECLRPLRLMITKRVPWRQESLGLREDPSVKFQRRRRAP